MQNLKNITIHKKTFQKKCAKFSNHCHFQISSGAGKQGKRHEGLMLSQEILQSHSHRGSGGPGVSWGQQRMAIGQMKTRRNAYFNQV